LLGQWWFRLGVVLYYLTLIISPFYVWYSYVNSSSKWCYDTLYLYLDSTSEYQHQLATCTKLARDAWGPGLILAIIVPFLVNLVFQLILFKIIVNYIVLGGTKSGETRD
jgi:hypothetical protein